MHRFIAVDNVCAWPNLVTLPSGELVVIGFNQPCHGNWEGDVDCWASVDGKLWSKCSTVTAHEPGTNRMNHAAGIARNGDLIVLVSGWSNRPKPYSTTEFPKGQILRTWTCRSSDAGHTWTVAREFPPAPEPGMDEVIPFGDILQAADGSLGVSTYTGLRESHYSRNSAYFHRSTDDGRTWEPGVILAAGDYNETTPLHLGHGKWLAAARTLKTGETHLFISDDDGRTWRFDQPLTLPAQHPANLIRLHDGRILLTYGNRCHGMWGIDVRLGDAEGRKWSRPARVVALSGTDLGYPSSEQRADSTIVTVYYSGGVVEHNRYHLGAVTWGLDEIGMKV